MDDFYVILAILVLSIFIFIILFSSPYSSISKNDISSNNKDIQRIQHQSVNITKSVDPNKLVCFDPNMQSMNSRSKGKIGTEEDQETLSSFYIPGKENVPEDYPLKLLGECPYSKPLSNDLPIANVPLCIANKNDFNMKLEL